MAQHVPTTLDFLSTQCQISRDGLTAFLYQRMRDYCIGMISSSGAIQTLESAGSPDISLQTASCGGTKR
jgi:hypothetical protein